MVPFPVAPVDQILCETLDPPKSEIFGRSAVFSGLPSKPVLSRVTARRSSFSEYEAVTSSVTAPNRGP